MLLQFEPLQLVYILLTTIFLWLMLWLATRFIVSKSFASDKKVMLLLTALLAVLLVPIVAGLIVSILDFVGQGAAWLRNVITPGVASSQVGQMTPIIAYLIFYFLLKFMVGMDWKDTLWVSLIGIFLLYVLYSALPELTQFYNAFVI